MNKPDNLKIPEEASELKLKQKKFSDILVSEQMKIVYRNLMLSIPSSTCCACLVFLILYLSNPSNYAVIWFATILVVSAARFSLSFFYYAYPQYLKLHLVLFQLGVVIAALLWGAAGSILMPANDINSQMVIIITIAGITAGGIQALQANQVASVCFVSIILVPLVGWFFSQKGFSYELLGSVMSLYLFFMIITSLRGSELLNKALKLQFENINLAQDLSKTNADLKKSNIELHEGKNTLDLIQENAPIGMAIVSLDDKWMQINNALCNIVGYSRVELEKLSFKEIAHPDDLKIDIEHMHELLHGKSSYYQFEIRLIDKTGQIKWILMSVSLMRDTEGKPLFFIKQMQNISEQKTNEKVLSELNKRTSLMLSEIQQHEKDMAIINKMNELLQICKNSVEAYSIVISAASELFVNLNGGLTITNKENNNQQTVGQWGKEQLLKSQFSVDNCWALRVGDIYIAHGEDKKLVCNHYISQPSGSTICLPLSAQSGLIGMLNLNAPKGVLISNYQQQIMITFSEVMKLSLANIQLHEALREQATVDPLTGLFNRRYLDETLPRELQRITREKSVLCVSMIDVDFFKHINDTYGHNAGDEVLRYIGDVLKNNFRGSDIACRFGGEEFVVVLVNTNIEKALPRLENIRKEVKNAQLFFLGQPLPMFNISIGIAEAPRHGLRADEVIRIADEALYVAKQSGRDKVVVADSDH